MSRQLLAVLLAGFALVLIFGYSALIMPSNDPRPVPTNTPGPGPGNGGDDESAGRAIWEAQCSACHTIDGSTGIGPTWQGLFGSEVPLEDGSTVVADEDYIIESIRDPNAKVHEGFQPVMPAFPQLTDEEIDSLILFMQSLDG